MHKEITHGWTRIPVQFMVRIVRLGGLPLLILFLLVAWSLRPQASKPAAAAAATPPPLPQRIVYGQLFKNVVFLDHLADLAEQGGRDGSQYRNFYQNRAGLTSSETAALKQAANNAATAVQAVETQIQIQIALLRPQFVGVKPSSKKPLTTPPIFKTLQAQKDAAILNQVTALQAALGSNRFQQFDSTVQTLLTPHITVATMGPPRPPASVGTVPLPPAMPNR
jgi:hypothetical protein